MPNTQRVAERGEPSASVVPPPYPPPPTAPPCSRRVGDRAGSQPSQRGSESIALGWLVSATLHLLMLLLLALLLAPRDHGKRSQLVLELVIAKPDVEEVLDSITIDPSHVEPELSLDWTDDDVPLPLPDASTPAVGELLGGADLGLAVSRQGKNRGRSRGSGAPGTFFGTQAYGDRFVYVLDMSSSMSAGAGRYRRTRFEAAAKELVRSVNDLRDDQFFYVVLFSSDTRQLFDSGDITPTMVPATSENKRMLRRWINRVKPQGGTDPRLALRTGLQLNPSAVFLLSDGEFSGNNRTRNRGLLPGNPTVEQVVSEYNPNQIPIHAIAFENQANRTQMDALARMSGGRYRFVSRDFEIDDLISLTHVGNYAEVLDSLRWIVEVAEDMKLSERRRAAPVLFCLLSSESEDVRQAALEAMLAITDLPEEFPDTSNASIAPGEVDEARRKWTAYWSTIRDIDLERRAGKLQRRADMLKSHGQHDAAAAIYRQLIQEYPFTKAGVRLRSDLDAGDDIP